jgi:hypothetical protein
MSYKGFALAAFFGMAAYSSAALRINEVYINPPDGSDPAQGREFIEIFNDGNASAVSLTGKKLIVIENEGSTRGTIKAIFDLSSAGSLAAGRKLVIRDQDSSGLLATFSPAYETGANAPLQISTNFDLENEGGNFVIVDGLTGTVGTDLDTDNNGVLNSTPWTTIYDWVTIHEGQSADSFNYSPMGAGYQTVVTSLDFESPTNSANPDVFARVYTRDVNVYTAIADGIISEVSRTGTSNDFISPHRATTNDVVTLTGTAKVSPGAAAAVFSVTFAVVTYYHP